MIEFLAPIAKRIKTLYDALTTNTRMANLDNLDAAISAISPVASVQYGTISMGTATSATATISSVTTAKAFLILLGTEFATSGLTPDQTGLRITLTNSTTVTASRQTGGSGSGATVGFVVVALK